MIYVLFNTAAIYRRIKMQIIVGILVKKNLYTVDFISILQIYS